MNASSLPDVLKPNTSIPMSNVDVYTSILNPINATQNRVIFNLRQTAILNPGSRVIMSIHPDNATANTSFLPVGVGIGSCIQTAILRCGARVLATSENFNQYYFAKRSVHTRSQKNNIDMVLDGGVNSIGNSPAVDGAYAPDVSGAIYTDSTNSFVSAKYKPVVSQTDCPLFSLSLSDLFPLTESLQLPLFLMEPVSIELILTQQTVATGAGTNMNFSDAPTSTATSYGLNNFQMNIDYLQYDDDVMEQVRQMVYSERGMPLNYFDLSVSKASVLAVAQPASGAISTSKIVREIGSAGLKVKDILITETTQFSNGIMGKYRSDSPIHAPQFNFRVNNHIIYPRALSNTSLMRNEAEQVLNFPMSCPSCVYSHDVSNDFYIAGTGNNGRQNELMDITVTFEKQNPNLMAGTNFITALNLERGPGGEPTMVQHKNILYERTNTFCTNDFGKRDLTFYTRYQRSFVLRNGVLLVSA